VTVVSGGQPAQRGGKQVMRVSGGQQEHGHLEEFRTDPIALMQRVRDECGDVGWFQLADKHVILLSGAQANELRGSTTGVAASPRLRSPRSTRSSI
jgi:hypothetical protein